jgi:hypothetical protein
MHVQERFEIASNRGFFDGGFHRRLWIKPVSPERAKPSSYQVIGAKIDGRDAVLRTTVGGDVLDVGIAPETGTLPRGNHVIELSYTAKYQFTIYDDYEDTSLNISGDWPVVIARATVELNLPEAPPKGASIDAGTVSSSNPHFDCVETDLPSGVRFETTHPLPLETHLFLEARFPHPGYFVSNVKEDGFLAVLENHPLLIPLSMSICSSVVFLVAGIIVWRRVPRRLRSTSAVPADDNSPPTFWREAMRIYRFPMVMFALAIVPGLNFTYSGHGGPSWLFAPLCFPWVIVRILIKIEKGSEAARRWYKRFFKLTIPAYIAIALPLSWAAATSIRMTFGLPTSTWTFFALMVSPFPWLYAIWFGGIFRAVVIALSHVGR